MRQRRMPTEEKPYVTFALALNYFDPDQRKLIEHIEQRTNYSAYFQRLVLMDMEGTRKHNYKNEESFIEEEVFAEGLMSGVL